MTNKKYKICRQCGILKPLVNYLITKDNKIITLPYCSKCIYLNISFWETVKMKRLVKKEFE